MNRRQFLASTAAALPLRAAAPATWPQFRGPNRDGVSRETGLMKAWPQAGPKQVWAGKGLGVGYGSLAITENRIFVQGGIGRESCVHCVNRGDGKILWTRGLGGTLSNDRGDGPRSTPTVEGDRLWVMTENGDLAAMDGREGKFLWNRNILKDFGGNNPHWLVSESPLVDGEKLVVTPGGRGAGMVAIDKSSGKEIWRSSDLSDPAAYASAIAADVNGVRCYMNFTARAGVGVRASDGKLLWRYERPANNVANCAAPVFQNNKVFYTSAYGTGGGLFNLNPQGEVYFTREMQNHHGGVVLVDGYMYGFSNAILTCIEFETGKVMWKDRSVGKGCLTYADGRLFLLGEGNTVGLAEASPQGYKEVSRFSIPDSGKPSWAYPVVCGNRLYIRNQDSLMAFEA
jgi:outer membrane protein assembly factor BamB